MGSSGQQRAHVFGLPCADVPLEAAAGHLIRSARTRTDQRVVFVNAHCLNVSVRDRELEQALRTADVIYADGAGMALAARMQGGRLKHNVNGTDLFPHLCREAAAEHIPMALLGGRPGVADRCARILEARHPGLKLVWCHHGFLEEGEDAAVVDGINRSGARILLVAMGVPRQERWIMNHFPALDVPVALGVGGLFDFVSGNVPRAPALVRRMRLEWLFRLAVEPRRLCRRYLLGNPVFFARSLKYAATGRLWSEHRQSAADGSCKQSRKGVALR